MNGYKEIKDIISHIDEFYNEYDLRESLQEILFVCEANLNKANEEDKLKNKIQDLENNIELLVNNLSEKNRELISNTKSEN